MSDTLVVRVHGLQRNGRFLFVFPVDVRARAYITGSAQWPARLGLGTMSTGTGISTWLLVVGTFTSLALLSAERAQLPSHSPTCVVCLELRGPECINQSLNRTLINDELVFERSTKDLDGCNTKGCSFDCRAEYAIVNNVQTSWKRATYSPSETNPAPMGLTLDLGQVNFSRSLVYSFLFIFMPCYILQIRQGIQRIEVYYAGKLSTPQLHLSSNGINFSMVNIATYRDNFWVSDITILLLLY